MKFYVHLISILFLGFYRPVQCKNICEYESGTPVCCINYHMENGKCLACPVGSYGVNCSEPCPKGIYGEFCKQTCRCSEDEVCDISYGCIRNSAEVTSTTLFKTNLTSRNLQTTEHASNVQDDEPKTKFQAVPIFLYLVSGGCASLLCTVCFLVIYRNSIHSRRRMTENDPPLPPSPPHHEPGISHNEVINVVAEAYDSDYAEIRECNPTYSSCAEASSVYNVLSFSGSKYRSASFNTTNALYSTSASCSLQKKKALSLETKSDTDDIQFDPTDLAAHVENQSKEYDVNITKEEGDSTDFANQYII